MSGSPARILIVRLSHLGDVVHALPVYHALRYAAPDASLGWVVQDEFAPLVEGLPGIERVFRFGRRAGLSAWLRLDRELCAWAPQLVVDAQGNVKSAMTSLVSRAPRRVGLDGSDWTERFAGHVVTDPARPARGGHAIDRMLALVEHLAPGSTPRFDAELTADEVQHGRELCDRFLGDARRILAVPRAGDPRSLTSEQVRDLARQLAPILCLSGPGEGELGDGLAQELAGHQGIRHWVGQRGLRELAGFFHAAAERGARLIACDSGPMHLAAASGLPVDLLAGPQAARRTGPWPLAGPDGPHRVFRHLDSPDCAPCLRPRCHHRKGPVCMTGIDVEELAARLHPQR